MTDSLFYILVALPPLPKIGEKPPISLDEVNDLIKGAKPEIQILIDTLIMEKTFKRIIEEKIMGISGDVPDSSARTFIAEMPEILAQALQNDLQVLGEDVWLTSSWRAFFEILRETGMKIGSPLLCRWVSWETTLREQLRIVRGGLPFSEEFCRDWDHRKLIDIWASQEDPMVGERILDEARWEFIDREVRRYSFDFDEFTAYALKLGLLERHSSMSREKGVKILEEITIL